MRFFGLSRPIARYLERLTSHDVAFRALAGIRTRFYERIEPLAPAELGAYRSGDLLSRMVGDVDALQNLYLRGLAPPAIALVGGVRGGDHRRDHPASRRGGARRRPAVSAPRCRSRRGAGRSARATAEARGTLSAEVIELLQAAPELVVHGAEAPTLDRLEAADVRVAGLSRREGWWRVRPMGLAL